jgi:Pentose-5-phosphate-3-epimerase
MISLIKKCGKKAGVSLNPNTSLTRIENIVPDIELLLVMAVNPGFGGQKFIEDTLPKITNAGQMLKGLPNKPMLEVDGGVNLKNIKSIVEAGAQVIVAGASIFGTNNYQKTIAALKAAASK